MKKKFKRSAIDLSSMTVEHGYFVNATIKVNSTTKLYACSFKKCKFIKRGFYSASLSNCCMG